MLKERSKLNVLTSDCDNEAAVAYMTHNIRTIAYSFVTMNTLIFKGKLCM